MNARGLEICFVVGELFGVSAVGGGERQIALLAEGLSELGHRVTMVGRRTGSDAAAAWPHGPVIMYEGPVGRRESWVRGIRDAVVQAAPDVIYQRGTGALTVGAGLGATAAGAGFVWGASSDADADGVAQRFARSFRQRVSTGRSGASPRSLGGALADASLQHRAVVAVKAADGVVAQSGAQAESLRDRLGDAVPIAVIRSIAPVPAVACGGERRVVLWIGADKPVKRPGLFRDLVRTAPDSLDYVMVGKGLQAADAVPGLSPRVMGALAHNALLDLISEAAVVVNTSEAEGFPNTFLEAWSRGTPVLTLGVDPDGTVSRTRSGWVCRDVTEAAAVLRQVAADPEVATAAGARGAAYVASEHSRETSVAAFAAVLAEAAAGSRERRSG